MQLTPFTHFTFPHVPFPLVTITLFSVSMFIFVWFGCLFYFIFLVVYLILFFYIPHMSVYFILFLVVYFILFFYIPHMSENIQHLSFSIWLIPLSIIPSRSIHIVANGKISSFCYGWVVLHCVYILHLYPFIHWWALRLFPYLGYCK